MENLTKAIKNSNLEKLVNMIYENTITKPMEKARKDAFLLEVNTLKRAASSATSLIIIGSVKDNYTKVENGYCFTAANLESLGLIENYEDFEGIITVRKGYNNEMSYEVEIANDLFYIKSDGDTSLDKVMSRSNIIAPIKTTCN